MAMLTSHGSAPECAELAVIPCMRFSPARFRQSVRAQTRAFLPSHSYPPTAFSPSGRPGLDAPPGTNNIQLTYKGLSCSHASNVLVWLHAFITVAGNAQSLLVSNQISVEA